MVVSANKAFMGAVLNRAFALDLRPELAKITAATLVIRGELDAARTRAHVEELLAGIPTSTAYNQTGGIDGSTRPRYVRYILTTPYDVATTGNPTRTKNTMRTRAVDT